MINSPRAPVVLYYTFFCMYFIMCSLVLSDYRLTRPEDVCQVGKTPNLNQKTQNGIARICAIH